MKGPLAVRLEYAIVEIIMVRKVHRPGVPFGNSARESKAGK